MRPILTVLAVIIVFVAGLAAVAAGLITLVAFADYRAQDCFRWPDHGNCSDAVGTMIFGSLITTVMIGNVLLAFKRRRVINV